MGRANMTPTKRYLARGKQPMAKAPYHYRACGLDDVYLKSGFTTKDTAFGPTVFIEDVPGLHKVIGHSIITDSKPISPREFRFLRKNMDLTQHDLAERLRVDVQTVARYEKDQSAIPGSTDMVLRIMFALFIAPPDQRDDLLDEIEAIIDDQLEPSGNDRAFALTKKGWEERAGVRLS